jgi:hypothetical protein
LSPVCGTALQSPDGDLTDETEKHLGLGHWSLIAATSFGALAQGQGAVEGELFYKKQFNDSVITSKTARVPGISKSVTS